ncbi:unnamed protein product [Mytilus coruscus]|uniref:Secreted protein n=1 Tax=Mytilus coruscus TaxID=42192 RepID=A0A6J8EAI1_MYTCO|nr:unnamed protein product [Mytilus coruscus]
MFLSYLVVVIVTSMVLVQCRDCKDYDLSVSDQSFLMKHYLRTSRKDEGLSTGKPVASGVTYVRWGKKGCPKGVEIVYTGQAGGNQYTNKGGDVNYLCLPNDPENGELVKGGRKTCYKGWTFEYNGYIMSDQLDQSNKEYVCADKNAEPVDNKTGDENRALFYGVKTKYGSLRCPPYKNAVAVHCIVCTK